MGALVTCIDHLRDSLVSRFVTWFYNVGTSRVKSEGTLLDHIMILDTMEEDAHSAGERIYLWLFKLCMTLLPRFYGLSGAELRSLKSSVPGRAALKNIIGSIAELGVSAPQTLKAPLAVVWSLSYRCNLKCKHCYQNANTKMRGELELHEQLRILDELADAGVSLVTFSGGEPLLNRNLYALIRRASSNGLMVSIDSNGVLIDGRVAKQLKEAGVSSVEISIDFPDSDAHDEFRGMKGAFNLAVKGVKACVSEGLSTAIATTVTKVNYHKVANLVELARSCGAQRLIVFHLIPVGRGESLVDSDLSMTERQHLIQKLSEVAKQSSVEVFTELPQFVPYILENNVQWDYKPTVFTLDKLTMTSYFNLLLGGEAFKRLSLYAGGCPAGRLYCNIQPNGNVTPCMFMPEYPIAGNLRERSFKEIWCENRVFKELRDRRQLKGLCACCKFRTLCGGCRARAAAYYGDYLEQDPACLYLQSANRLKSESNPLNRSKE